MAFPNRIASRDGFNPLYITDDVRIGHVQGLMSLGVVTTWAGAPFLELRPGYPSFDLDTACSQAGARDSWPATPAVAPTGVK